MSLKESAEVERLKAFLDSIGRAADNNAKPATIKWLVAMSRMPYMQPPRPDESGSYEAFIDATPQYDMNMPANEDAAYPRQGLVHKHAMTQAERTAMNLLVDFWNAYVALPDTCGDQTEVRDAIHRIQGVLAIRVARRVDHDVWR